MHRYIASIVGIAFLMILLVESSSYKSRAGAPRPLTFVIPPGFPPTQYDFKSNPLTIEGVALGRKLFYENKLSKDGNFPCSSCHQQFAAFATYDHDLSHGFNNQFTTRNAPGLFNLAWQKNFHWDGGINHLEVQPLAPLTAPNEMAEDISNVIAKLKADKAYPPLFKAAFGNPEINSQKMLKALAQFMLTLVSADAKYDRVKNGTARFNTAEENGYTLFKSNCASCHKEPLFTDLSYRNDGLSLNPGLKDYGRMRVTGKSEDSLKFKVPSLRNAELTFSYMHDGRFTSFDQVLRHYESGIQQSASLDSLLKKGFVFNQAEKFYLKSFLRTLTDSSFTHDPRFAMPK
jgi:cytochrome c peroxidase